MTLQAIDAFTKTLSVDLFMMHAINSLRNSDSKNKLNLLVKKIKDNAMQCADSLKHTAYLNLSLNVDAFKIIKEIFIEKHRALSHELNVAIVHYSELSQEHHTPAEGLPTAVPSMLINIALPVHTPTVNNAHALAA